MRHLLNLIQQRPACASQHFGPWMVEPQRFTEAVQAVEQGLLLPAQAQAADAGDQGGFIRDGEIAIVGIQGMMTKGRSSFGGTSTLETRATIRDLAQDPEVAGIMLWIDSPGGMAAGTSELADDIHNAAKRKPVHCHASDLMASAAAFAGMQARRVTINAAGEAGSFGTVARLVDFSEATARDGIKVHVISTGPFKGAFTGGAPIPEAHLDYARETVEALNRSFLQAIERGRPAMSKAQVKDLFFGPEGGKVWPADRALKLGIVDGIESFDQAMENLRAEIRTSDATRQLAQQNQSRRRRAQNLRAAIDIAR